MNLAAPCIAFPVASGTSNGRDLRRLSPMASSAAAAASDNDGRREGLDPGGIDTMMKECRPKRD
jgi:hypothetical protein